MSDIFVGRIKCLEALKEAWNEGQYRIFGIYGPKSVGKTCYVENFLRILKTSEKRDKTKILSLDFQHVKNFAVYIQTIARWFDVTDHNTDAHINCQCIPEIIRLLNSSDNVYIFHHDHQEEAKSRPNSNGNLPDSTQQCLWDKIYTEIIRRLVTECRNFYLIISSTDEFLFAHLRGIFWKQKIPELMESDSLELLTTVWPSAVRQEESCKHIVRLCDGIPPAIINAGLLLNECVISVEEVIQLMMEQIMEVLSDEFLPNSEKINAQLRDRWGHLGKENCDNLVKIVIIIKNTSQSTISATSKLCNYKSVAEFKFKFLLPLLRRNLVGYNKDDESVSLSPLIQHILDAVNYIKAEDLHEELQARIKAILELQPRNETDCRVSEHSESNSLPYSDCVDFYSSKESNSNLNSSSSMICLKEPTDSQTLQENEDLRSKHTLKNSPKVPVENESDDSNDLNEQTDTHKNKTCRQHSFTQNLNRKSLENEKDYVKKGMGNSRQLSHDENLSLNNEQSVQDDTNPIKNLDSFPKDHGYDNRVLDADKNIVSKDTGGSAVTKYEASSSIDKFQHTPVLTLSGEIEIRSKGKPENTSSFDESIPKPIKHDVEVGPDVTIAGENSVSNSDIHRRHFNDCEKLRDSVPENKKISSNEATAPKTVFMLPIQVSEESGQTHSFKQDNFASLESQPNALSHNINNDLQSRNVPSNRLHALDQTDYLTCTKNAGLVIRETPSSYERFQNSNQNNHGFNYLECESGNCDVQNTHLAHPSSYQCSKDNLDTDYQPASHPQTPLLVTTPSSYTESPEVQNIHSSIELPKVNRQISPPMAECLQENDSNNLNTCVNQTGNMTMCSEEEVGDGPGSRRSDCDTSTSASILSTIVDFCTSFE